MIKILKIISLIVLIGSLLFLAINKTSDSSKKQAIVDSLLKENVIKDSIIDAKREAAKKAQRASISFRIDSLNNIVYQNQQKSLTAQKQHEQLEIKLDRLDHIKDYETCMMIFDKMRDLRSYQFSLIEEVRSLNYKIWNLEDQLDTLN
ncbi:MAG: hypothetical protein KBC67_02130 [Candidatus Pacebacteria bacterium]|nr:hypothetical protein [Candidatus Paceibacterota bacterium]